MKWTQVKHEWPSVQAEVKRTWGRIDEADLAMIHGERDSFTNILAQRYGYEIADAEQKLDVFIDRLEARTQKQSTFSWLAQQLQKCWGLVSVSHRR